MGDTRVDYGIDYKEKEYEVKDYDVIECHLDFLGFKKILYVANKNFWSEIKVRIIEAPTIHMYSNESRDSVIQTKVLVFNAEKNEKDLDRNMLMVYFKFDRIE